MSGAGSEGASSPVVIRAAGPADAPRVWALVREFAAFERLERAVTGSAGALAGHLSGERWPRVECLVAESDARLVGYALFFGGFSSFRTRPLLWLEDVFVAPSQRGSGVGLALMRAIARTALERGCAGLGWEVLDWNAHAIAFYERLGAMRHGDWLTYRLDEVGLRALAGGEPGGA